ncbi:MAG: zinc ribbon domain-containing protein [Clostridiales bacterium]|nr:zinc ribbon domain-containing protein [Clostridiales bacterium]
MKKICPNCGRQGIDGSDFCGECGKKLVDITQPEVPSAGSDPRLIQDEERARYSLRNGYIANIIAGNDIIKDDALISNRRVYVSHRDFNLFSKKTVEARINLEDISAMTIVHQNPWNWFVLGLLSALAFFAVVFLWLSEVMTFEDTREVIPYLMIPLTLAAVFFCIWIYKKKSYLKIEYASGGGNPGDSAGVLTIPLRFYGLAKIREFQKEVFLAKDELEK